MLRLGAIALAAAVVTAAPAAQAATYLAAGLSGLCSASGCFAGQQTTYRQVFSSGRFSGALDIANLALDRSILGASQDRLFKVSFQLADGTTVGDWGSFMIAGLGGQVVTLGGKAFTWDTSKGDLVMTLALVVPQTGGGGFGGDGFGGGGQPAAFGDDAVAMIGGLGARPGVDPYRHLDADEITGLMTGVTLVPEPAAWALMLGGFGAAGAVLRNRRKIRYG
ncbi:PEPxxWA-CTERM sorting domain-containing protein [Phenylobacterium sp.]|uniref:PEPxxWA-CTERM sorting domain-containing protein n=1 Tax=Phenylobacterium sp. TaxID=1871053 RepID=UPI0025F46946|nr:PEPxxWA-CTERM sorting domain-containing protein [Phenylobacterium sp.]